MVKFQHRVIALAAALASLGLALAQAPTATSIASGFNAPMGLLAGPDGDIWVIDSGLGGEQEIESISLETGQPATATVGDTARIVRVSAEGEQTVVTELPSIMMGQEASGGARLALIGETVYATNGVWAEFNSGEALPLMASVVRLEGDAVSEVANLWTFENAENPDGFIRESHPYGLAAGSDGMLYLTDAGANTLFRIDPESGETTLLATFEGVPGPLPNPGRGGAKEADPVPTGVVAADDGTVYVSLLPGFPFTPGSSKVVAVSPAGDVSDYATGLTMVTDLKMGPDGALYAVQFGKFGEQGPTPASGAVVRIQDGESETVMDGLSFPTALAFGEDGSAYLTVNGVGAPGSGEVVSVSGLTD